MMVVWAIDRPRSSIISTRSRKLSLKRRYHRTHRTMTSRSKCRPLNRSSKPTNLATAPPHKPTNGLHDSGPTHLHQSRMNKSQQMRWSRRGADLVLQVRCAVYIGTLGSGFGQRFERIGRPDVAVKVAAWAHQFLDTPVPPHS